jgi:hypothetical protein
MGEERSKSLQGYDSEALKSKGCQRHVKRIDRARLSTTVELLSKSSTPVGSISTWLGNFLVFWSRLNDSLFVMTI